MKNNTQKPAGKNRGSVRVPVALMLVVCMSASVVLAVLGVRGYMENHQGSSFYGDLSSGLKVTAAPQPTIAPAAPATPDEATPPEAIEKPLAAAATGFALFTPQPRPGAQAAQAAAAPQMQGPLSEIDFAALWQTCPDVVGWVTIPDTVIDYPIVHGEDNEFYLYHLPDGTKNAAGSIMMDQANSGDFSDDVNILHGHHMRSGAMFGDLELYEKEAYYKEHPMMRLYTPQGDYDVAIFAAYSVDGSTFAYPTNFTGEEGFEEFYRRATTRTPYRTDVGVEYGDRMLMLSTCAYSYEFERFLVVGKILDE